MDRDVVKLLQGFGDGIYFALVYSTSWTLTIYDHVRLTGKKLAGVFMLPGVL